MGADQSRRRTRQGQAVAVLVALCASMAGGAGATAQAVPKTAAQCNRQFKPGAARSACLKRVKKATKCSLETSWLPDGGQIGDAKDFTVKLKQFGYSGSGDHPVPSQPETVAAEVTLHNPRIVICRATISRINTTDGSNVTGDTIERLTIGPHGGLSSRVTVPAFAFPTGIHVWARLG